jgi:hypothetical protein
MKNHWGESAPHTGTGRRENFSTEGLNLLGPLTIYTIVRTDPKPTEGCETMQNLNAVRVRPGDVQRASIQTVAYKAGGNKPLEQNDKGIIFKRVVVSVREISTSYIVHKWVDGDRNRYTISHHNTLAAARAALGIAYHPPVTPSTGPSNIPKAKGKKD